jgi:hypothetical protein
VLVVSSSSIWAQDFTADGIRVTTSPGGMGTGQSGLALGYGGTYNGMTVGAAGYLQAESQGVAYRPFLLQPLGGNVGVGLSNPQVKLQVRDGDDSLAFYAIGNNRLAIQTILDNKAASTYGNYGGGENALILQPLVGNIGIGAVNPKVPLQISRNGYSAIGLGDDDANVFYLTKETADNSFNIWRGMLGASANFFKITSSGNVGLGVSNPTGLLSLPDRGNGTLRVGVYDNRANAVAQILESLAVVGRSKSDESSLGAVDVDYYGNGVGTTWSGAILRYLPTSYPGSVYGVPAQGAALVTGQNSSKLIVGVNSSAPIHFAHAAGIDMTILEGGKVGIGTSNPRALLQISRYGYGAIGLGDDDANVFYLTKETSDNSFNIWRGALGASANLFKINASGNIGIGTSNPQSKLAVNGTVTAKEVIVTLNGWSDYVFAPNYRLAPLSEVAKHIESERHLPGIPSEAEIVDKGLSMGEMQRLHMAKIEELTLYAIQAEREAHAQRKLVQEVSVRQEAAEAQNMQLKRDNRALEERLARLERVLVNQLSAEATQP